MTQRQLRPEPLAADQVGPLTRSQNLLWVGQRLSPNSPLYNMAIAVTLPGAFDHARFCQAFGAVVAGSDAMRSVFFERDGVPYRATRDRLEIEPELIDLSGERDPDASARDLMRRRAQTAFDLERCLVDTAILRLRPDLHVWFVNQHHLITDGTSKSILVDAVRQAYDAVGSDIASVPSFHDFVQFEAAQTTSPRASKRHAYWHHPDRAEFGPVRMRAEASQTRDSRARRVSIQLTPQQTEAFNRLVAQPGVHMLSRNISCFMVFATALLGLLHRLSGEDRVAIGTASQNRGGATFAKTLGYFTELYPFGAALEPGETFKTLLTKVQAETQGFLLNAFPSTATPEMQRQFDVVLNYITAEISFTSGAPETEWIHTGHSDPGHALRVEVQDFGGVGTLTVMFDISEDVFGADNNITDQFFAVFNAVIQSPDTPIAEIALPGARSLSSRADESEMALPLHQFAHYVAQRGDSLAVRGADGTELSFRDLDARATQFACDLITNHAVQPGECVGLFADRSADMIVGLLAILKAGAAFVPIDPAAPVARQQAMLDDTGARLWVGADGPSVGTLSQLRVAPPSTASEHGTKTRLPDPKPNDLAYVIYTSGSTGTPNGVLIEHRNIAHLVSGLCDAVYGDVPAPSNVALIAPLVFDAAIQQVFGALMQGHNLILVPDAVRMSGPALVSFLADQQIDICDGTPAHLGLIAEAMQVSPTHLPERFLIGGEALMRHQLEAFYASVAPHDPQVTNVYGVAECCVDSTSWTVRKADLASLPARVPIGRPLPGTEIQVLSPDGVKQPPFVPGEIALSGGGVGRGYLGKDDLTKARFRSSPDHPDAVQYLTGDIGWYDDADALHFDGRRDGQIKLRGIRIEPKEIEHALRQFVREVPAPPVFAQPADVGETAQRCTRCALTTAHPGVTIAADGVCSVCHTWDQSKAAAEAYFQDLPAFDALMTKAAADRACDAAYDCMLLYSGGKDSSYVLHRLVERGLRVLAFTFDNGFISKSAFAAIKRHTNALGVDSVIERTTHMDDIFVESLSLDDTVCSGCFRALTAISTRMAHDMGINVVVTGLSRGQIFDTKLDALFRQGITEVKAVEENLGLFRQVFHANKDRTAQLLNVDLDDVPITKMHFVDFFRYDAASVQEVRTYLGQRDAFWQNPQDTGFCSSNCLMNDVGICVHSNRRTYHNYEAPLSWDIRLGVSDRADVLEEVAAPINLHSTTSILRRIGFYTKRVRDAHVLVERNAAGGQSLTAYVTATQTVENEELRAFLADRLPGYMVPARFVQVDRIPLTVNGKVDTRALRDLGALSAERTSGRVAAKTPLEATLVEIWQSVLGRDDIGTRDNFFDLGGDSIGAIRIVGRANARGLHLSAADLLAIQTIEGLAARVTGTEALAPVRRPEGHQPATPIVRDYLAQSGTAPPRANAMVLDLDLGRGTEAEVLSKALGAVVAHHDAFRLRSVFADDNWGLEYRDADALVLKHLAPVPDENAAQISKAAMRKLALGLSLQDGPLIAAAWMPLQSGRDRVLLALHHVACDVVGLAVFLDDLWSAYDSIADGQSPMLAPVPVSYQSWAEARSSKSSADHGDVGTQWQRRVPRDAGQLRLGPSTPGEGVKSLIVAHSKTRLPLYFDALMQGALRDQDAILAAVASALSAWTGQSPVHIDVETHGRDGALNVSRTMGWFASHHPLVLKGDGLLRADALPDVARQADRAADLARDFAALPPDVAEALPRSDLLYNFIGGWGEMGATAGERGRVVSLDQVLEPGALPFRPAVLNVFSGPEEVTLHWTYDAARVSGRVLARLTDDIWSGLETLSASILDMSSGHLKTPERHSPNALDPALSMPSGGQDGRDL